MFALTTVASTLLDRVAAPASEVGHGRFPTLPFPTGGPPPGACFCWHSEDEHLGDACINAGCGCAGKFRRDVHGWLTLALALIRGGK